MFIILLKFSYSNSMTWFFNKLKKTSRPETTLENQSTNNQRVSHTNLKYEVLSTEPTVFKEEQPQPDKVAQNIDEKIEKPQEQDIKETTLEEIEKLTEKERAEDLWNFRIKYDPFFKYMLEKATYKTKAEIPKEPLSLQYLLKEEKWENSEKLAQEEKKHEDQKRKENEKKILEYQALRRKEEEIAKREIQKFYENQQNLLEEKARKEKEERYRTLTDNYSKIKNLLKPHHTRIDSDQSILGLKVVD